MSVRTFFPGALQFACFCSLRKAVLLPRHFVFIRARTSSHWLAKTGDSNFRRRLKARKCISSSYSCLIHVQIKKKLFSFCRLHNFYFALLMQFFGNNRTLKQFGVKGFQNSPLFIDYLFFLVFYCALFGTHLTRNSNSPR